jgi:hypothetical protein
MMCQPRRAGLVAVIAIATGCGDNGDRCGEGTTEVDGVCMGGGTITCGDGTKLENGQCVIDPSTCQAGTVLIANQCVDPASSPLIDLEESVEPNGMGVVAGVEASTAPAGTLTLTTTTPPLVIHGQITPFQNADGDSQLEPDFDTYLITTPGPVMIDISVDGVGGAQGAFYLAASAQGMLPAYERYGLNLTGDTSRRRLILPVAGDYSLVIGDTRSLAIGNNPPRPAGAGGAAGGPDAEYYATIAAAAVPPAMTTAAPGGSIALSGELVSDSIRIDAIALPAGIYRARQVIAGPATASVIVVAGDQVRGYGAEGPAPIGSPAVPAEAEFTLVAGDGPALIIGDAVYNYGPAPERFDITIAPPP